MYFSRDTKRRQVDDVSGRDNCDGPSLLTVCSACSLLKMTEALLNLSKGMFQLFTH